MRANFGDRVSVDKTLVLSKSLAAQFECDRLWACISVCTYAIDLPKIDGKFRVALLQQSYPDWDKAGGNITEADLFSVKQAHEVLDFVDTNWANVGLMVIHCEAGISRSSATAAAILEVVGKHEESQSYFKPPFHPNMHVYRTILNTWRDCNDTDETTTTEESERDRQEG